MSFDCAFSNVKFFTYLTISKAASDEICDVHLSSVKL